MTKTSRVTIDHVLKSRRNGGGLAIQERDAEKQHNQQVLPDDQAVLISRPRVTLYVNRTEESRLAFQVLENTGIGFRAVAARRRRTPVAEWGGVAFKGLSGVQELVSMLQEFESVLLEETRRSIPDFLEEADPKVKRWTEELRDRQLREARMVMDDLYPRHH